MILTQLIDYGEDRGKGAAGEPRQQRRHRPKVPQGAIFL